MAEYENSEDLTTTCEGEISELLQADLNLRGIDWTNSSNELVPEDPNEVQEEICESVVEEIVGDQANDNYLECMEDSILYVFEEQIVEYELSDFLQAPETFEMEEAEVPEPDAVNFYSSQEHNIVCEENEEQGTSKIEASDDSVNNCGENELVLSKCTVDLPISSDNSLKTCNFNENSDSVDNNLLVSELIEEDENDSDLEEDENVIYGPMPRDIDEPSTPENMAEPSTPENNPKLDESVLESSSSIIKTPNLLPSVFKNQLSPLKKISSEVNSPTDTKSPQSDSSSPALRTLGKEQIKKRLQSFSLMKQGITAIPIKKIISPKAPKVHMQIGEVYDETGRKTDKEMIIKKPPKQGPTPSEKAKQVIDEIEQIKREEAAIYEQTLSYMKYSMRDAHRKKSKLRGRVRNRSKSPIRKDKKYDEDIPKRPRKNSEDDKFRTENDKHRKSTETDKHRKISEHDKYEKKRRDKMPEKPKEEEIPNNWTEIKQKNMDFEKISKIKSKLFKYPERKPSPVRLVNKGKHKKSNVNIEEVNTNFKKEDYIKPQLMFEVPSLLRTPLSVLGINGKSKNFPTELIRFTEKSVPCISYCENPNNSSNLFRSRKQVLSEIPEERAEIMMKIIENKNESLKPEKYISGLWYDPLNYLTESKNEVEIEAVKSYGLSVLSEMYDEQDEPEETHEEEIEKSKNDSKEKKKKERKKSKKKHKKHKSKSKSRSSSKDRSQEDEGGKDKKSKKSKKKKHKDIDDGEMIQEIDSTKFEIEPQTELEANTNSLREEKIPTEDGTPNTDEYRSNWESDEDIMNEIIRTDESATYNKSFRRSLDQDWTVEESISDVYDNRRTFNDSERRQSHRSLEHLRQEEMYEHSLEFISEIEDRRSSINLQISEERYPRHSYEKPESRRDCDEFEYRHSSTNLKTSGNRLVSRLEEIAGYDCRSSNLRRSEDKSSSRYSYDRSDSRKSYDHRQGSEENADYEPRRTSLRRSEEKERAKHYSESDNKKSRELRHESIEKPEDRYRKTSETDSKRSRESVEEISEDRSHETLKKYDDRYKKSSVEKSDDRYTKTSESDRKRSKESVEKIQKISEDRSQEPLEKYDDRCRKTSLEKSDDRFKKISESDSKRSRESVEKIQKISENRSHEPLEKYDDRCRKTSLEKSDGRYRKTSESSKLEDEKRSHHSSEHDKKTESRRKSRFDPIEKTEDRNSEKKYEPKKVEDKVRESSERDNKKQKDKRHESLDKSRDQKIESEEKGHHSSKQEINEKHAKESREKKISCSSDDRKRDSKLERSRTPDRKKVEQIKYEEKKDKNIVHNKWSSDEDIQRSYRRYSRNIEQSPIQLNLNYKHQKSQWSSDEDLDRKKNISDSRRSRNFEDNFQLQKSRPKSNISENDSSSYRSRYENLLDDDLVNLKDLERNRKLAEEKEKRNRSKEKEDYRKSSKKKSKAEKKKHEEREKYKRNKKKIRDKKQKSKSKDKKTKVKITYSDLDESYDEDFKTAKQKEQDLFIKTKCENVKKHAAKIKIDYSDFDLSLFESKDKYDKKFEEEPTPNIPKVESAPHTPKERKVNIDLSEIISDHQVTTSKNVDIETPKSQTSVLSSINTPESFITISEISESPKTISDTSETSKSTVKIAESSKLIPITCEKLKPIPDGLEPSKPTQKTVEKPPKSSPKTPEIQKSSEVTKEKLVTPISAKNSEEPEHKTPKNEPMIEGITQITPKNKPSSIMVTPTSTPIKILPEITPVAPPTPIPKPIIEPVTPVTPDPSKLVSEYEEFMKAVSFDEPKDDVVVDKRVKKLLDVKEITLKQIKDVEEKKPSEIIADSAKDKSTEESDSSLEESSSEYESSESEHSDSSSESESLSPDSAKHRMLETVAKIKKEKVTDSENESQESRKRKDRDLSPDNETFKNIVVKTEKDSKKMKKYEELKPFECSSKYDNIIDWEKTCIDNINYTTGAINLPTVTEMLPPLPENIPLPNDEIVPQIPVQDIPTPEDYLHTPSHMQSPADCIYISSDNTTPSPTKKPRAVIPIKLLTAESRKQANETAKLVPSDHSPGFGKFAPSQEEKVFSVDSSSDVSRSESLSIEDQEQNAPRKRQSQWALSITPAKKPLLQTNPLAEEDSDEDFTDKFVKQTEKKIEKKTDEVKDKDKLEATVKESSKSEVPSKDDKKPSESRKPKEDDDRSRRTNEKCDKPREKPNIDYKTDRRSPSPKLSEKDKRPRRNSRERPASDKTDRNDPKVKPRDSLDRKRDRSPDRSRDRNTRENIRDRLRRLSERRASIPDRKVPFSRGRSPRSRYSRDRELQRSRLRDRSKDRVNKIKTPERDRSRERIRERSRDSKDRRDRSNYRRDERRYSRSPSPHRKEYKELDNIPVPQQRPDDTDFSTTSMDIAQSPVNSPLDGFKRSLADSTISDSELVAQHNTPDESNEPSPRYNPQQFYPQVKEIPPERHTSPQSPKRISLDDRISLLVNLEKEPPKHIDTVCTRGPYTNNTNYDAYSFRSEYDLYNSQPQPEGFPPYSNQYQQQYYPNQINTDNNIKVLQVGNVIQVVPTEQPPPPLPITSTSSVPKPHEGPSCGPPKVLQVGNVLQIVPMTIIETAAVSSPLTTIAPTTVVEKPVVPKPTDQLVLERRAEKEKRRQEREQRRKEKEKKRKEKEKRRQMKIKTKTENMIKRALMLETGDGELDISNIDTEPASETNDNNNQPLSWPPASSLTPVTLPKPPSKGILVTHGFREKDESLLDDSVETRKVVKFADGICPGEGTSPSGGEELPSPPPPPRKLPKEKRYKKVKNKNKKKIKDELTTSNRQSRVQTPRSAITEHHTHSRHPQILVDVDFRRIKKVKIIRTQQQNPDDDSSSEDNLPPPPPPPGSPPPHLWPPRVKPPPVNNIHPALPSSVFPHGPPAYPVPGPGPQQMMYPPVYPPISAAGPPVVMTHAPPPPRQHHPPVMPVGPPPPPLHHGAHQSSFHH